MRFEFSRRDVAEDFPLSQRNFVWRKAFEGGVLIEFRLQLLLQFLHRKLQNLTGKQELRVDA